MMVPIPAPVPLMALTEATDSLLKRSEGRTLAMVEKAAEEKVAKAKSAVIAHKLKVNTVGMTTAHQTAKHNQLSTRKTS